MDPGRPLGDDQERDDLEDDHEDPGQDQRPRGDEGKQDRPDDRVEQRHEDDRKGGGPERVDRDPGQEPAVARNENVDTSRIRTSRLNRAHGPPRHSQRTRSCVLYRSMQAHLALLGAIRRRAP